MTRTAKTKTVHFEKLMDCLEEVVDMLEAPDLSLEDALKAYQEGIELAKQGHKRLEDAEAKIQELTEDGELIVMPKQEDEA